ncbi:MAG: cation:proton antiporter [Bacteroidales bacterium]|nr:cation:proton antiporter [Bacteroidales bacterium]
MAEIEPLIADLALILICAGIMTLVFKKLKQPLVLGYIVAGFIASPHFALTPSVIDTASIHTWSDIGVIFLLFALGLEFSFKKIVKVGGPAVIAALTIIFGMIFLGFTVGSSFGWSKMDALFLGGMISMSSTTIIYKAFEDLGLAKKQFAGLVMSILILEDILAVVLMVVLSTVAVSNNFEGRELLFSVGKLVFFLVLWILVGIYLIPLLLRKAKKLMNDETLLVVALGLCFGMVVLAAKTGFSAAFGAFIMGSILAETIEAEHIEHLVKPVKDLFGAIFFVSVGMMVDPAMIAQYWLPILVITLTVIVGQLFFATTGVLLSGQPLKTAMQCGFSLTQIGEFAFIIATLGVSLGVTGSFLYPIVVAVSVITIFLTPYMIRLAEPAYGFVYKHLPGRFRTFLDNYAASSASPTTSKESEWKKYLGDILKTLLIYGILCIAICGLSFGLLVPFAEKWIPAPWAHILSAVVILLSLAPFLRTLAIKGSHSEAFQTLWEGSRANRAPLVATVVLRYVLALGFVFYVLARLFHISVVLIFVIALVAVFAIISSNFIKHNAQRIERNFMTNFRSRELRAEYLGEKKPEYASRLLSKDMHLADFDVPAEIEWGGKTLAELNFGQRFGIHVVSILRGGLRINIPKATDRVFPQDHIQVIGSDSDLEEFGKQLTQSTVKLEDERYHSGEMLLRCVPVTGLSPFVGQTIRNSGIREHWHCLVAGVEKEDGQLHTPDVTIPFEEGDILWIVGEKEDVDKVMNA